MRLWSMAASNLRFSRLAGLSFWLRQSKSDKYRQWIWKVCHSWVDNMSWDVSLQHRVVQHGKQYARLMLNISVQLPFFCVALWWGTCMSLCPYCHYSFPAFVQFKLNNIEWRPAAGKCTLISNHYLTCRGHLVLMTWTNGWMWWINLHVSILRPLHLFFLHLITVFWK